MPLSDYSTEVLQLELEQRLRRLQPTTLPPPAGSSRKTPMCADCIYNEAGELLARCAAHQARRSARGN